MTNLIKVYQNNTKSFFCTSPVDTGDYDSYFSVKRNITDPSTLFEIQGTPVDSSNYLFEIDHTYTNIEPGKYLYDITIESATEIHTIVKDILQVLDAVRY